MWKLGRTIRVGSGLEDRGCLALVGHVKLAGDQDHALGGRVPVQRQLRAGRDLEEDIGVGFRGIPTQHSEAAPGWQEVRARTPLES